MMIDNISKKTVAAVLVLAALSFYLFFFRLGAFALTDPDETFYAQTAKEMVDRGEWHTPYLYGKPQFEKPILLYWLVEASFRAFGVNEFAARLPSAVFALFGIMVIYFLGSLLFNKRVGMLSAVILAASVEYVVLSRACVTDMVLTVFMLLGALFFFYGQIKNRAYYYILSGGFFALAVLTKGPVAIMLPAVAIGLYLLFVRDFRIFKSISLVWIALAFIIVAAPWYILMYKIHGNSFIDAFFGFHNVNRFLEAEHKIGSQWYYNIPIVFGGFFPWSVFLPFGLWHAFKKSFRNSSPENGHLVFAALWFFVIFIFFSISSTKLPTYIFPSFIGLALIVAVLWDDLLQKTVEKSIVLGMKISQYLLLVVVIVGSIGALIYLKFDYPSILPGIAIGCALLIIGMILSTAAFAKKIYARAFLLIVCSVLAFAYPMSALVLPQIERFETSKEISEVLSTVMKKGEALGCESNYQEGLAFYTGVFPVNIDKHHDLVNFMGSKERIWCVLKEKNYNQLYDLDTKPFYTKPSFMIYKLGKKAVVTNKMPEDGKYILMRERTK
ncbi:MAG: glycosyltransferase family 39 protein [Candidatus Omnitrophica bacterium]|nr:glycosyltransferase family 39 protein [Candidatus Omnitrophota bacterium]